MGKVLAVYFSMRSTRVPGAMASVRWVTKMNVLPVQRRQMFCQSAFSVWASRAEVASSKKQDAAGAQEGAGDGNALRLPFAQPHALFAAAGVQAVRQLEYKGGAGIVEGLPHVFFRGMRIAEQQVVADGAAEERVALRHVGEVRPRCGAAGYLRPVAVEADFPRPWDGAGRASGVSAWFFRPGFAHDGCVAARWEVV